MADDDLDLGLNLIFDAPPPSSLGGGGNGGGVGVGNKKRKTKYDKRRERGRLARLAREGERIASVGRDDDGGRGGGVGGGGTMIVDDVESDKKFISLSSSSSSLAGIAAALGGGNRASSFSSSSSSRNAKIESRTSSSSSPFESNQNYDDDDNDDDNDDENHHRPRCATVDDATIEYARRRRRGEEDVLEESSDIGGGGRVADGRSSSSITSSSMPAHSNDDAGRQGPDHQQHQLQQERQQRQQQPTTSNPSTTEDSTAAVAASSSSTSSRRHQGETSLNDEERTRYLAEFHARPRDLDRNEKASRDIKASRTSDHIFGGGGEEGGNGNYEHEYDDDGEGVDAVDGRGSDDDNDGEGDACNEKKGLVRRIGCCPFTRLGLHPKLVSALTSTTGPFKLARPTIVQSRCISALLPRNVDGDSDDNGGRKMNLFVQSETGSGKTLAYLLPIVQHLVHHDRTNVGGGNNVVDDRKSGGTRCVLLCPTRELATQTHGIADRLCRSSFPYIVPGCLSGGEKRKSEKARLRRGITILIATPGRLLDHLTKTESLLLSLRRNRGLEWLVLDEADRLLDGGGLGGQVEQIVQRLRGCCGGSTRTNGSTANAWRSVLVSATITTELEGMARRVLGGGGDDGGWMWARGHNDDAIGKGNRGGEATMTGELGESLYGHDSTDDQVHSTSGQRANDVAGNDKDNSHELDNAAPRQLAQLYMIVSAKLRLSSLIAFLAARAAGGERTVVFFSTCDSVDYHHALFASMGSVLGGEDEENDRDEYADGDGESEKSTIGIFGRACSIYKLHGDVPHHKRVSTLRAFSDNGRQSSAILLATDVAARGLNFPSLDWIVQYDPPCETKDYVHRAGRSARAGQAGHALLFLLPSERQYIEVLGLRGLRDISPLSLSSTLSAAAALCKGVTREGKSRASMGSNGFSDGGAEAFTYAIQSRLEECVVLDDESYRTSIEKKFKGDPKQRRRKRKDSVAGPLLEGARKAFSAFVRAYPAKEKAVRHIFNARALHLGHIARSLALKETPKMVSKGNISNSGNSAVDCGEGVTRTSQDKTQSGFGKGEKRNSRLAFGNVEAPDENVGINDFEQERYLSLLDDAISGSARQSFGKSRSPSNKKIKLGGRSGKDNPKRMMEAAMLIQSQEYM